MVMQCIIEYNLFPVCIHWNVIAACNLCYLKQGIKSKNILPEKIPRYCRQDEYICVIITQFSPQRQYREFKSAAEGI